MRYLATLFIGVVGGVLVGGVSASQAVAEAPAPEVETGPLSEYRYVRQQLEAAVEHIDYLQSEQAKEVAHPALQLVPVEAREALAWAAEEYGIPVEILVAVGEQESRWQMDAVGAAGEVGPMQVLPSTAAFAEAAIGRELDLTDPADNVQAAAWYLRWCYDYEGDWARALAAYNGGPDAWDYKPVTRAYAAEVLARVWKEVEP